MKPGETIGLVLIALALLAVGLGIHSFALWSLYNNWTLPWLCSALALAALVIGLLCALTGKRVGELDIRAVLVVYAAVVLVGGIGIVVDGLNAWSTGQLILNLAEWAGFAVLLLVLLLAPRCSVSSRKNGAQGQRMETPEEGKGATAPEEDDRK